MKNYDAATKQNMRIERLYEMICIIAKDVPLSQDSDRQFKAALLEFQHLQGNEEELKAARAKLDSS